MPVAKKKTKKITKKVTKKAKVSKPTKKVSTMTKKTPEKSVFSKIIDKTVDIFERVDAKLVSVHREAELHPGDLAPNVKSSPLFTDALQKTFKGKPVVLFFYPKDNTPGCTIEACAFRDLKPLFDKAGAGVLGISPDDEKSHEKFKSKYDLSFDLIPDTEKNICTAYGVWVEKSMYGKKYFGVERSTFLLDRDGKIAKVWRKVKVQGHAEEVLKEVKKL